MTPINLLELEAIEIDRQRKHDEDMARFYALAQRGQILRSMFSYHGAYTAENREKYKDAFEMLQTVEREFFDLKEKLFGYR